MNVILRKVLSDGWTENVNFILITKLFDIFLRNVRSGVNLLRDTVYAHQNKITNNIQNPTTLQISTRMKNERTIDALQLPRHNSNK